MTICKEDVGGLSGGWRMITVVLHRRACVSIWWCLPHDDIDNKTKMLRLCLRSCSPSDHQTIWPRILPLADLGAQSISDFFLINFFSRTKSVWTKIPSSSASFDYHLKNSPQYPSTNEVKTSVLAEFLWLVNDGTKGRYLIYSGANWYEVQLLGVVLNCEKWREVKIVRCCYIRPICCPCASRRGWLHLEWNCPL